MAEAKDKLTQTAAYLQLLGYPKETTLAEYRANDGIPAKFSDQEVLDSMKAEIAKSAEVTNRMQGIATNPNISSYDASVVQMGLQLKGSPVNVTGQIVPANMVALNALIAAEKKPAASAAPATSDPRLAGVAGQVPPKPEANTKEQEAKAYLKVLGGNTGKDASYEDFQKAHPELKGKDLSSSEAVTALKAEVAKSPATTDYAKMMQERYENAIKAGAKNGLLVDNAVKPGEVGAVKALQYALVAKGQDISYPGAKNNGIDGQMGGITGHVNGLIAGLTQTPAAATAAPTPAQTTAAPVPPTPVPAAGPAASAPAPAAVSTANPASAPIDTQIRDAQAIAESKAYLVALKKSPSDFNIKDGEVPSPATLADLKARVTGTPDAQKFMTDLANKEIANHGSLSAGEITALQYVLKANGKDIGNAGAGQDGITGVLNNKTVTAWNETMSALQPAARQDGRPVPAASTTPGGSSAAGPQPPATDQPIIAGRPAAAQPLDAAAKAQQDYEIKSTQQRYAAQLALERQQQQQALTGQRPQATDPFVKAEQDYQLKSYQQELNTRLQAQRQQEQAELRAQQQALSGKPGAYPYMPAGIQSGIDLRGEFKNAHSGGRFAVGGISVSPEGVTIGGAGIDVGNRHSRVQLGIPGIRIGG